MTAAIGGTIINSIQEIISPPVNGTGKKLIKVLIVESEAEQRDALCNLIEPWVIVLEAGSMPGGLRRMDDADIMFLSWQLGEQTGEMLLSEWVRSKDGPVCVICNGDIMQLQTLHTQGAHNIITKPYQTGVVLAILHRYLKQLFITHELTAIKVRQRRQDAAIAALGLGLLVSLLGNYEGVVAVLRAFGWM